MKPITESFKNTIGLPEMIQNNLNDEPQINEGLKEVWKSIKDKFEKVYQYLKGLVVKAGSYFLPVDENGDVMEAITPMTAGQAWNDGVVNRSNTLVVMGKEESKLVRAGKITDFKKLYGNTDPIAYWSQTIKESEEGELANVNEVKLTSEDPEAKYNRICDPEELKEEILMHVENRDVLAPLLIWGAPGIGKTAIVNSVVDVIRQNKPKYNLIFKTLSNETPDNFVLPAYQYDKDDVNKLNPLYAIDIPKSWLPVYKPTGNAKKDKKLDEACGEGLMFIDELSRATAQVLNVILPLINEKVFNGYKLGSGWSIICASNRTEDDNGQEAIGNALANRFDQVFYEPTIHTWKAWAEQQNFMSPLVLQWLSMPEHENMSGGKFYYMDPNQDSDLEASTLLCTPRSWTSAMRKLACYNKTILKNSDDLRGFEIMKIPTRIIARVLNSAGIPASAVDALLAFLDVVRSIGDFDAAVRNIWAGKKFNIDKKNLNKVIIPFAQMLITSKSNILPTQEEFENLCDWLVSQNSDQLASCVIDVFKHVYLDDKTPSAQDAFFTLKWQIEDAEEKLGAAGRDAYLKTYSNILSKSGYSNGDYPDYTEGMIKLAEKYQAAFAEMTIDGKAAFG